MRTVAITGASRGLGLEFVRQYSRDGWAVVGGARRVAEAKALQECAGAEQDGDLTLIPLDVGDKASIHAFATQLADRPVDILINNAGIMGPANQDFGEVDASGWGDAIATNVIGPLLVSRALLPSIRRGDLKRIVVITSRVGSIANASGGRYVYRTTKAAANMVVKNMAADLAAEGIDVVAIHPGWVRTDMGGEQAPVTPEQSVAGIRSLIDQPEMQISGRFFDFEGNEVAW